jgi:hypothetical protein
LTRIIFICTIQKVDLTAKGNIMQKIVSMKGKCGVVPDDAVYVGRAMRFVGVPKSKWANPFKIGPDGGRIEVMEKYRAYLESRPDLLADLHELEEKDLAVWQTDTCCHAEVLFELLAEKLGCPIPDYFYQQLDLFAE